MAVVQCKTKGNSLVHCHGNAGQVPALIIGEQLSALSPQPQYRAAASPFVEQLVAIIVKIRECRAAGEQ